jgi:hypothetical protein
MLGCSYGADLLWLGVAAVAYIHELPSALGLITSISVSFMITWYSLRVFDRYAFTSLLHAELGVWASLPLLGVLVRLLDALFHLLLPIFLICRYLAYVKLWMSPVSFLLVRLVHRNKNNHPHHHHHDHHVRKVFFLFAPYEFTPPRSPHFWAAAYQMELVLNGTIPLLCVLVQQVQFVCQDYEL